MLVGNKNCKRTNYYILLCKGRTASLLQLLKTKKLESFRPPEEEKFKGKPACHSRARENNVTLEITGNEQFVARLHSIWPVQILRTEHILSVFTE